MLHFDGIFHFLSILFFSQKDERKKCPTDRWTSDHAESLKCKWNVRQNFEHKSDCFSVSEFQAVNLTLC